MPFPVPAGVRAFGVSAAGWILLALARTAARLAVTPRPPAELLPLLGRSLLLTLPWIVVTPALIALAERSEWRAGRRRRAILVHVAVALACSVVDAAWSYAAFHLSGQPIPVGPALWYLGRLDQTLFLYLCLVAIGIGLRYRQWLDTAHLARTRLETQLLHARLHVLSLQLQPHFLFNTLNAVSELVHRDARAARETLTSLSDLLRRTLLTNDDAQEHTLGEELALLEPYLRIQRTRFTNLTITVHADERALAGAVPRLLLQPLVENAIRHGTSRRAGPGRIGVRGHALGERLIVEVEDDGPGLPGGAIREGVGLGNSRARLRELHGSDAELTLTPWSGGGTMARIACPLRAAPPCVAGEDQLADRKAGEATTMVRGWGVARLVVVAWLGVALLGAHEDYVASRLMGEPEGLLTLLGPRLGEALLWLALTPAVLWVAHRVALEEPGWAGLVADHLAAGALTCSLHVTLTLTLVSPGLPPNLIASVLVVDLALYAAVAASAHAWTLGRAAAERRVEAERLAGDLSLARLELLRWRVRPELVFRTLDTIAALAPTDPGKADEMTGRLGELLRLLLPGRGEDTVPLRAEVAYLTTYLEVARNVGLAAPRLDTALGPGTEGVHVPRMLLQPLTELVAAERSAVLEVSASVEAEWLRLAIRADGDLGRAGETALAGVRKRLVHLFGQDCGLSVERDGRGTVATLAVPWASARREVA